MDYSDFLYKKSQIGTNAGFEPIWMPDFLFDFQRHLVEWAIRKGRAMIAADCGLGKGQPPDAPVLTPNGWVAIGSLVPGDQVIASDGKPYAVRGVYPKVEQDTFRVHYSDGVSLVVDTDHLHIVRTNNDRQRNRPWRVMSTSELLASSLRYGEAGKSRNYDIPVVSDVEFAWSELPVDPYVLGAFLGDGHLKGNISFSSADVEVIENVCNRLPDGVDLKYKDRYDWKIKTGSIGPHRHPFRQSFADMNLLGLLSSEKFIPDDYLFSSPSSRLLVLQGLMDTDGYVDKNGTCQFYSVSKRLADGVVHLVRSIGGIPTQSVKNTNCNGKPGKPCYMVTFSLATHNPFLLTRKAERWNPSPRDNGRWIDRIEFEKRQRTVCISVDSPDSSYVTDHFIVTHNTPMFLTWAENVVRKTNKPVLILTPLAVSMQVCSEGKKFGIEAERSTDGKPCKNITVANYERLDRFSPDDFSGVVCDESSIIKHWSGSTQKKVTRFLSKMKYRLLCTATPAPNDFIEMGTASEALGELTQSDMLATFFRQISDDEKRRKATASDIIHSKRLSWRVLQSFGQWALKAHAFEPFWRWVSSWAIACRKPSDVGPYSDETFVLPELVRYDHIVEPRTPPEGWLWTVPAFGLNQERSERRRTLEERTELVVDLTKESDSAVVWCHLNPEGDILEKSIPGAVQVKGSQSMEEKEELITSFLEGQARVLVTKAKIAGLGLNMQRCAHVVTFVDHSWEKFYQCIRRCWRFGQKRSVRLDVIATEGETNVKRNMDRKENQASTMFDAIIKSMNHAQSMSTTKPTIKTETPSWLLTSN